MAEQSSKTRRWNGFVCPECRHVFRVARDHDGRGIVCPACRRLLRLPAKGERTTPLIIPGEETEPAAEESTAQSGEVASEKGPGTEGGGKRRRRRREKKKDEVFDETFAGKEQENPALIKGIVGSLVLAAAVFVVVLLWPKGENSDPPLGQGNGGTTEENASETEKAESEAEKRVVSQPMIERDLVPVYRKFLGAKSIEEMAKWVCHPETTLPRMRAFYGNGFASVPFKDVIWSSFNHRNRDWITVAIEDEDFDRRAISVKEEDGWKVDWESWVGWSDLSWEQLRKDKPEESLLLRVAVTDVVYYNFSFSDDIAWNSYLLESPDGENAIYGYVPRGGVLDAQLQEDDMSELRNFLIKVKFPEGARSDNQVLIEEVILEGWLDTREES